MLQPTDKISTKLTGNTEKIITWISKGFSDESTKSPTTPCKSIAPKLKWSPNSQQQNLNGATQNKPKQPLLIEIW